MKISIITPSFNQAEYIGRAIESVQSQRGDFELEHIVVDGGSTDGTWGILRDWGDAIRWTSESDRGQGDALNKGLAMASGEVIGWLNSDDIYEAGALQTVAEILTAEPRTQWVYGKVRIVDEADREIRRWITAYKNRRMRRFSRSKLLAENWISQMGVFWRREFGRRVGPFRTDLHYCMDYDYWLRMSALARGRFVDRYLACFRWRTGSKSGGGFAEQFREELRVAREAAGGQHQWAILRHRLGARAIVLIYSLMRRLPD